MALQVHVLLQCIAMSCSIAIFQTTTTRFTVSPAIRRRFAKWRRRGRHTVQGARRPSPRCNSSKRPAAEKRREVDFEIIWAEFPGLCLDMILSMSSSEALRLLNDHQKACKESSRELKLMRPLVHRRLRLRDPFPVPSPTHTL